MKPVAVLLLLPLLAFVAWAFVGAAVDAPVAPGGGVASPDAPDPVPLAVAVVIPTAVPALAPPGIERTLPPTDAESGGSARSTAG